MSPAMGDKVKFTVEGGVATLTLSDPPANTYSYEMMQELDAAILRARMDDDVHVLVVRGEGDKFFCAGADIACWRRRNRRSSTTSACTRTRRSIGSSRRRSW